MQEMAKGCNKLPTLSTLLDELDPDFRKTIDNRINNKDRGHSLLRLLRLVPEIKVEFPTHLLSAFMRYYRHEDGSFEVSGQRMNVTLEDILYLTNLPIVGRAVVPDNNRDNKAFQRVFSTYEGKQQITLEELKGLCTDTNITDDERIKATLLMIVTCLITLNANGHHCNTSFV